MDISGCLSLSLATNDIPSMFIWIGSDHTLCQDSFLMYVCAGPRSAVGNVSGYRCVSECRSRGREFDPGPVPYFRGD